MRKSNQRTKISCLDVTLLQRVLDSEIYLASYPVGTGDNFPRDKMFGRLSLQFISCYRIPLAHTVYLNNLQSKLFAWIPNSLVQNTFTENL
jgi:hypothetical protein